ncbi:MAG: ABC transporter ATP-binding protein [Methylococcaceae bacterium]
MTQVKIDIKRKRHGLRVLFERLRIDLQEGQFAVLVGPSGCGKTSLLNLIAGLDPQFEGEIAFASHNNRPRIGYVFQEPRLLPWRTVAENIRLAVPEDTDPKCIEHLMEQVGLSGVQQHYPEQLSLGMSRRVALVRAFAIDPDLLLMDEPLVSLDTPTARRVRELMLNLWLDRPHTVLYVTHDMREAIELADRLIFLSPAPCQMCGDVMIPIPRSERDPATIEAFHRSLGENFPELSGLL